MKRPWLGNMPKTQEAVIISVQPECWLTSGQASRGMILSNACHLLPSLSFILAVHRVHAEVRGGSYDVAAVAPWDMYAWPIYLEAERWLQRLAHLLWSVSSESCTQPLLWWLLRRSKWPFWTLPVCKTVVCNIISTRGPVLKSNSCFLLKLLWSSLPALLLFQASRWQIDTTFNLKSPRDVCF